MRFLLFSLLALSAQMGFSQARIGTVEYLKSHRQSIVGDFPFAAKTIESTIEDKLEKMGYKAKSSKGFTVFRGVTMPELGTGVYDLYFSVDKKSKREKDNSVVTMMISKGYENFVSEKDDPLIIENAKKYVDNLKLAVEAYDLEGQINEQEDVIKKNVKKAEDLVDEGSDLEKKLKKIQQQIEDNKKAQTDQEAEVQKQKEILEMFKSRRKH